MTRFIPLLFTIFAFQASFAQTEVRDQINAAIRSGNAKTLASYFTNTVDLTVGKNEEVYSKEQAEVIMARFFSEHPPTEFAIKHEGHSKSDDQFFIGDLGTKDKAFRVSYFLKKESTGFRIRQLRIESE
jgi:hypothetical protein